MTRVGLQHWEPQALKDWIKCVKCNGLGLWFNPYGGCFGATEKCPDCGGIGIILKAPKRESNI